MATPLLVAELIEERSAGEYIKKLNKFLIEAKEKGSEIHSQSFCFTLTDDLEGYYKNTILYYPKQSI